MTVLLEALTWWPWNARSRAIHHLTRSRQAPGLVTLGWRTDEPCPTVIERPDGTVLFRDDAARDRHSVTLTGNVGHREVVVIRSVGAERTTEVAF